MDICVGLVGIAVESRMLVVTEHRIFFPGFGVERKYRFIFILCLVIILLSRSYCMGVANVSVCKDSCVEENTALGLTNLIFITFCEIL